MSQAEFVAPVFILGVCGLFVWSLVLQQYHQQLRTQMGAQIGKHQAQLVVQHVVSDLR